MNYSFAGHIFDITLEGLQVPRSFMSFESADTKAQFRVSLHEVNIENYTPIKSYDWFESTCTFMQGPDDHFAWLRVDSVSACGEWVAWQGFYPHEFFICSSGRSYVLELLILIAFTYATLPLETLVLHSSVVEYNASGYMFLGESGTGKSTHTRLWTENITGAVMVNDDAPVVRVIDGVAHVFGSPWSGKGCVFRNVDLPIAGIYRLRQAPINRLKRIAAVEAFAALMPSCLPVLMEVEQHTDMAFATLDNLISQTSLFVLDCLPNAEAAFMACEGR
ncbi:MAG: hypothetical protein RR066_05375 [Mucinivorans sp.]